MLYVPMLKTRLQELRVSKTMNECFSDKIIPLYEILSEVKLKTKNNIPLFKINDLDSHVLDYINNFIKTKTAFIDFFRFSINKYGKNLNINSIDLSWEISHDIELYFKYLKLVSNYKNLIPVISIKPEFSIKKNLLKEFLIELQKSNEKVALRLTEQFTDEYKDIIKFNLRDTDFLLFDIGEQNPSSKFIELEELMDLNSKAKIILLNSPRKLKISKKQYEESGVTKLIDNSARVEIGKYNFEGYGDYCGLIDNLPPKTKGSSRKGAAHALLYDFHKNGFYTFLNPDTEQGMSGYKKLIPIILKNKNLLDPNDNCPAYKIIKEMNDTGRPGNWSSWIFINLTRTIHQMFLYI